MTFLYTPGFLLVGGVILLCGLVWPGHGGRLCRRLETVLSAGARSRWALVGVVAAALLVSCSLLLVFWLPQPRIHDEFSYLLAADTFAHGRLANPTHPLWKHFENFHTLQHPTYSSKFPPGQGLFLALGQLLGAPILGVWISTALAAAAVFWMLMAMLPRSWSLLGAALALVNPQVLEWNWSYWGGSVALLGGALALGGFLRARQNCSPRDSAALGLGMGILCLSRPYEGFVLSLLLLGSCVFSAARRGLGLRLWIRRFVAPWAAVLVPVLVFQLYWDFRVTGNPVKMPYLVYEQTYSRAPLFVWQAPRAQNPTYHNDEMRRLYTEWVEPLYESQRTLVGFGRGLLWNLSLYPPLLWGGSLVLFTLPLIQALKKRPDSRLLLLLLLGGAGATFLGPVWVLPHYSAPFYPLLVGLLVMAMREGRSWSCGTRRPGLRVTRFFVLLVCCGSFAHFNSVQTRSQGGWQYQRAALQASLRADGRKHLVIVKYGPTHNFHQGWAWNGADIDRAPIVWANDLGEQNQELIDYFKGYAVTLVDTRTGTLTTLP